MLPGSNRAQQDTLKAGLAEFTKLAESYAAGAFETEALYLKRDEMVKAVIGSAKPKAKAAGDAI